MKRSPLIIVATLVILGGFAVVYIFNKKAGLSDSTSVVHIPRGQESTYKLTMDIKEKPQGEAELELFHIDGHFANYIANEGELVSEWAAIDSFQMLSKPVDPNLVASMLNKPMVTRKTNGELEHFVGKDFPGRFLGFQLGLLDKAYSIENTYKLGSEKRRNATSSAVTRSNTHSHASRIT